MPNPFPYADPIEISGREVSARRLIEMLEGQLTAERRSVIERVIERRTYSIAAIFDGPYDRGNVSAVIRSAEAFGVQPVHVIETEDDFKEANRVTQGADKWVDVFRWQQPSDCISYLHDCGYDIWASDLGAKTPMGDIDFRQRNVALIFGNESDGVSDEVLTAADGRFVIPMAGFTQSLNISVAAGIALNEAYQMRGTAHGDLSQRQREILRAHYYLRSIPHPERVIPEMLDRARNRGD